MLCCADLRAGEMSTAPAIMNGAAPVSTGAPAAQPRAEEKIKFLKHP